MGKEGAYPSGAPKDPLTDGAFVLNIPAVLSGNIYVADATAN